MVFPLMLFTTSPGRWAEPPGMFSVAATIPVTLIRGLRRPMAFMAPITDAPPAMSPFMSSIPPAGFREMPPVSKVIPFPMSPRLFEGLSGSPAVLENDELGRLIAALGHAHEGAHAHLVHLLPLQDLDVKALFIGHLGRDLRHPGWSHDVGGLIHHVPRHDGDLGQDLALLCAVGQRRHLTLVLFHDGQAVQVAGVVWPLVM